MILRISTMVWCFTPAYQNASKVVGMVIIYLRDFNSINQEKR